MSDRSQVKAQMIEDLLAATGERVPTSSFRRLGGMAVTMFKTVRLMRKSRKAKAKTGEAEMDLERVARIITSIGRLKGVAMKMGQIMSYIDMALPEELRDALSVLQTHAQPMPFDTVRALVAEELGENAHELLADMDAEPVSAASKPRELRRN